ncbi:MAG: PLP-dependent aminotransferase family protein [Anaerolineales bacterium]|nr:PLP-dependent aminotransferase family protein [Anaerolineales bacterium]
MPTPWQQRFAQNAKSTQSSAIRELFKVTANPEVISFGGGLPAPEVFPIEEFKTACEKVLTADGPKALQYSNSEGYAPLREMIARQMDAFGLKLTTENILITTGTQQSIDLISKMLINNAERILVEDPTFLGALQVFSVFGARYIAVPIDADGIQTELLPEAFRAGPRFMYIIPTFQNPGGVTLSLKRRETLIALSDQYGIPILEDDPYCALRFEGETLPPLIALDAKRLGTADGYPAGNVMYCGSFSKTLAPGLRLAWIAAPPEAIAKLVQIKQGADLHTPIFVQMAAYECLRDGFLERHIQKIRDVYRDRRNVMLAAMEQHFPKGMEWTRPEGGLFLWAKLPEGMASIELLRTAIKMNVAFVPGNSFFSVDDKAGERYFRLNFSNMKPERIQEGIQRLGGAISEAMKS